MIGKNLAHYEISGLLGAGGMGEVYRARDTKLGRAVAIKVLPKEMSGDPERAARFDREARLLASLQHANIASIYGFEHADGVQFLAMELVEGQSLEQRLREGVLPHDELQRIARQMAAGLEAAHDRGIVHRDLKPANVMLTKDGDVKILDFGLARAWFGDNPDEENLSTSPTITAAMTQAGTILGTAAYMSPEQARGKNVDRRADIWAFGVILWEMITGRRLFEGETISDTLAAVIRAEPEWELLPLDEQPLLCRLVERCLVRDPRQRLRDIGEARILLQEGGADRSHLSVLGVPAATSIAVTPARPMLLPMIVVALLCALLGAALGWRFLAPSPEQPLIHATIPEPEGRSFHLASGAPGPVAISPDGSMLAFAVDNVDTPPTLWLRQLDQGESVPIAGTDGAAYPFWSPDSQFIGFFTVNTDSKLKKVSVRGGTPVTLCPANNGKGGSWNAEGDIVFAPSSDSPLMRVPSTGGDPVPVTELTPGVDSHRHPRFLPDGRRILFVIRRAGGAGGVHEIGLASLDGDSVRVLTTAQAQAEYSDGHLLTVRDNVLMATPFDPRSATLTGGPTPLVEELLVISAGAAAGVYSTSRTGMLAYQSGFVSADRHLEWVEFGKDGSNALATEGLIYRPVISPDGRFAMVEDESEAANGTDLWIVDLESGLRTRFTFDDGNEYAPVWTPDSASVIYSSRVTEPEDKSRIMQQTVDGVGGAATLYESEKVLRSESITPDGSYLYLSRETPGNWDVVRLPMNGDGELEEILATPENEAGAQVSPDGRWIAYHGSSTATWDVFVAPVEGGRRKWQVTTNGAVWPLWKPDGSALFVSGFNGDIVAYGAMTSGESFVLGKSELVGRTNAPTSEGVRYSVHPDGVRYLRSSSSVRDGEAPSLIYFVTDWRRALIR